MKNKGVILIIVAAFGFIGCADQSQDRYKERAATEQEGANKVENENLAKKAEAMEQDLAKRHAFYGALEGDYQGGMTVDGENFKIKFTFARSIPPFTGNRVRQLSEIESDLNNLYFYMQVVQWHPDDQSTAVGCRVTGVRPNMDDGTLTVASTDCPNLYTILLSEGGKNAFNDRVAKAKSVAKKVKDLSLKTVPNLVGVVQPTSNAAKYYFSVQKTN